VGTIAGTSTQADLHAPAEAGTRRTAVDGRAQDFGPTAPGDEVLTLFAREATPLFRFCRSLLRTREEAEDVVQEVFVKLLRHLQKDGDRRNLRGWLFTVAANGCRDRIRARRRWLPWSAETDSRTVTPEDERGNALPLRRALAALPPRDRLLLSLRAQGLPYADIARASGIRQTSVGRLLARAVARWKREVDKDKR
jgi:RNA polymerase sigma-70 factor (ECF subfamily)